MKALPSRTKAARAKSLPLAGEEFKRIRIRKPGLRVRVGGAVRGKAGRVITFGKPVVLEFSPQEYAGVVRSVQAQLESEGAPKAAGREQPRKGKLQARRIARVARSALRRGKKRENAATHKPIEDVIAELAAQVPSSKWSKLPADLTENLDHYLYGTPKK